MVIELNTAYAQRSEAFHTTFNMGLKDESNTVAFFRFKMDDLIHGSVLSCKRSTPKTLVPGLQISPVVVCDNWV